MTSALTKYPGMYNTATLRERLDGGYGLFIEEALLVHHERSEFQSIEVFDTRPFGRLLRLDDVTMTSERDEFSTTRISFTCLPSPTNGRAARW